jgi:hypothetical protein
MLTIQLSPRKCLEVAGRTEAAILAAFATMALDDYADSRIGFMWKDKVCRSATDRFDTMTNY